MDQNITFELINYYVSLFSMQYIRKERKYESLKFQAYIKIITVEYILGKTIV